MVYYMEFSDFCGVNCVINNCIYDTRCGTVLAKNPC
jgi:hypothetical protein